MTPAHYVFSNYLQVLNHPPLRLLLTGKGSSLTLLVPNLAAINSRSEVVSSILCQVLVYFVIPRPLTVKWSRRWRLLNIYKILSSLPLTISWLFFAESILPLVYGAAIPFAYCEEKKNFFCFHFIPQERTLFLSGRDACLRGWHMFSSSLCRYELQNQVSFLLGVNRFTASLRTFQSFYLFATPCHSTIALYH